MKRIISFLLTVLLMVSVFCLSPAIAAAEDEPTFTVSSETAAPGKNVSVTIRMDHNPGIASIKLKVQFDNDLTLNSVTYNTALGGRSQQPQTFDSPVTLNWFNGAADTTGDMDYAVLDFTVAQDASVGEHAVSITYDENDVYNIAEKNIPFNIVNGSVKVTYLLGDVDLDGEVEIRDAAWIQRYYAEIRIPFPFIKGPADTDGDGEVTLFDATWIQYYCAYMRLSYPIGEPII